jgi:hypothetical protein
MHLAAGEAIIWTVTDDKVKRLLTTVLCADVHGYSRLMEADEAPPEEHDYSMDLRALRNWVGCHVAWQ